MFTVDTINVYISSLLKHHNNYYYYCGYILLCSNVILVHIELD